jgi:hypothetical protein
MRIERTNWHLKIAGMAVSLAAAVAVSAQTLPAEPLHDAGTSITGAFEGWFKNPDGTFSLLLGYFNRNQRQELDIPTGPDNRIEPGGPDRGQPTHFFPGRQYGMFAIKVPADFGTGKLTWTIVANGKTTTIPASLKPDWEISPFREEAAGNTPPVLRFEEGGPAVQGPSGLNAQRTATIGSPLTLNAWVADDAKWTTLSGAPPRGISTPVTIRWTKYRGPGTVTFSPDHPAVEVTAGTAAFNGKATVTATFSTPGDYTLHLVVNDLSGDGGGGEQCCWTFGTVNVTVR